MTRLILRAPETDAVQDEYIVVDRSPFLIGRRPDNHFQLNQRDISGIHAEIRLNDDGWQLVDRQSTNGTFLNGVRLTDSVPVSVGDLIQFATKSYRVVPDDNESDSGNNFATILADPSEIQGLVEFAKILDESRTFPHFQPIVNLFSNETVGWEALGRAMGNAEPIAPGHLFRHAAAQRAEHRLSLQFRESAQRCFECGHCWPSGQYQLWVNVHPTEFHDDKFLPSLEEFSNSKTAQLLQIVVEMPEEWACQKGQMLTIMNTVRSFGMRVAYDDFGSGRSRIPDLFEAPPDYIKLDRQLIANIAADGVKRDLVKAVVDACNKLQVQVLAEGIETEAELEASRQLGIPLGQGYLLARPSPPYRLFGIQHSTLPVECVFQRLRVPL